MSDEKKTFCAEVSVQNAMGLHGRPASQIVKIAAKYKASVRLSVLDDPSRHADASSMLEILILAAVQGTRLQIQAEGPEAQAVVEELTGYFNRFFDEN